MNDQTHRWLGSMAASQHGVFSRLEARAAGITDTTLERSVAIGRYEQLLPGVFAVSGSPPTKKRSIAATVLSFPALAAASHQTAAELWGLTRRGIRTIEVVTTRWDRVRRSDVKVHESLDLVPVDVVELDGIPITTPVRTVVDLGASNRWVVESALEEGIRRSLFTLSQVEAFVSRVARRGRRGVGVVRPLIEARRRWDSVTESVLEDEFRKLVATADLPAPEAQYTLRTEGGDFVCRADFAYPAARLLVELDSEAHHLDRLTFRRDRAKQNQAMVMGWTVLRFTWWDLREQPYRVVAEVRAAVLRSDQP